MTLDQSLAADRLLRGDVVLDDGAKDLEFAVIETHLTPPPLVGTPDRRVPVYVAARRGAMIVPGAESGRRRILVRQGCQHVALDRIELRSYRVSHD
ncbi:hypothetical protein Acsp02_81670 [Actinoplanes sp. NBRC 103695]|nr:hypothetical protein Acsp02_81670 [Actinoplanes sp. NBRC 103695]